MYKKVLQIICTLFRIQELRSFLIKLYIFIVFTTAICVRDSSGNTFLRHEKKIAADSPTPGEAWGYALIFYNNLAALAKSSGVSISTPIYCVTTIFIAMPFSR